MLRQNEERMEKKKPKKRKKTKLLHESVGGPKEDISCLRLLHTTYSKHDCSTFSPSPSLSLPLFLHHFFPSLSPNRKKSFCCFFFLLRFFHCCVFLLLYFWERVCWQERMPASKCFQHTLPDESHTCLSYFLSMQERGREEKEEVRRQYNLMIHTFCSHSSVAHRQKTPSPPPAPTIPTGKFASMTLTLTLVRALFSHNTQDKH